MITVDDAMVFLIVALFISVPTFMVGGAIINVPYRLGSGKFFDFVNLPTAIAFGVYLLLWRAILDAGDLQDFAVWQ